MIHFMFFIQVFFNQKWQLVANCVGPVIRGVVEFFSQNRNSNKHVRISDVKTLHKWLTWALMYRMPGCANDSSYQNSSCRRIQWVKRTGGFPSVVGSLSGCVCVSLDISYPVCLSIRNCMSLFELSNIKAASFLSFRLTSVQKLSSPSRRPPPSHVSLSAGRSLNWGQTESTSGSSKDPGRGLSLSPTVCFYFLSFFFYTFRWQVAAVWGHSIVS